MHHPDAHRHSHSHVRGLLAVVGASVLWGTGGLAVQLLREHDPLSPVTISAWRMAIAAVGLFLVLVVLRRTGELVRLFRTQPRRLVAVGAGTAAYQCFYFVSVTQVGVAVSTVVSLGLAPVLLTVADAVRERRRPTPTRLLVLATALVGLVLVSVFAGSASVGPSPVSGVILAAASGATYALTTAVSGPVSRLASPVVLTAGMTLVGALVLAPTTLLVAGPLTTTDPGAVGWLLYHGLLTMALAYVLLYVGLRVTAPSTAVTASLVEPVTAAVAASWVLDEPLGVAGVVGTALVLAAVAGLGRPSAAAGPVVTPTPGIPG